MCEFPLAVPLLVALFVATGQPGGLIALGQSTGLKQIPLARGGIRVHLNNGVHDVVDRKRKNFSRALKEGTDGLTAFVLAKFSAIPDRVLGKQFGNAVRIVLIVAQGTVAGLELFDGFNALQGLNALGEIVSVHVCFLLGEMLLPRCF